jgi:hypothetical protein
MITRLGIRKQLYRHFYQRDSISCAARSELWDSSVTDLSSDHARGHWHAYCRHAGRSWSHSSIPGDSSQTAEELPNSLRPGNAMGLAHMTDLSYGTRQGRDLSYGTRQ